jgi:hypothetical protein
MDKSQEKVGGPAKASRLRFRRGRCSESIAMQKQWTATRGRRHLCGKDHITFDGSIDSVRDQQQSYSTMRRWQKAKLGAQNFDRLAWRKV